ncbi:MAG: hypothetical protein EOO41_04855, partial [Methanobacteriota archaeon]
MAEDLTCIVADPLFPPTGAASAAGARATFVPVLPSPATPPPAVTAASRARGYEPLPDEVYTAAYVFDLGEAAEASAAGGGVSGGVHLRDPRTNGWELLYSEQSSVPVLDIPHQAAMARDAINADAVAAATASAAALQFVCQLEEAGLLSPLPDDLADDATPSTTARAAPFTR